MLYDTNDFDVIENTINKINSFDLEEAKSHEDLIKDQYIYFNNMGKDYIQEIKDVEILNYIFTNMIEYMNENYINILDFDSTLSSNQVVDRLGRNLYLLFCVDFYNNIMPYFLNEHNIKSVKQFDILIYKKNNFENNKNKLLFVEIISKVIQQLEKLKNLDKSVNDDENFRDVYGRYSFYLELISSCDVNNLIEKYIRPLLIKNFNDLIWRTT